MYFCLCLDSIDAALQGFFGTVLESLALRIECMREGCGSVFLLRFQNSRVRVKFPLFMESIGLISTTILNVWTLKPFQNLDSGTFGAEHDLDICVLAETLVTSLQSFRSG